MRHGNNFNCNANNFYYLCGRKQSLRSQGEKDEENA